VIYPTTRAEVLIDTYLSGQVCPIGVVGNNNGYMSDLRYHWVGLVDGALPIPPGMGVYIGKNAVPGFSTLVPHRVHLGAIENDVACQRARVHFLVGNERFDAPYVVT